VCQQCVKYIPCDSLRVTLTQGDCVMAQRQSQDNGGDRHISSTTSWSPPPWGVFSNSPTGGPPPLLPPGPELLPTLTHLDPSGSGWQAASALTHHWEVLGVTEPHRVLKDLGLHQATLDIAELSRLLQEEVIQAAEIVTFPTVQAGLLTIQTEARALRGSLDSLGQEKHKLRQDLQDANNRSVLLAQEIDEQHVRQERESRDMVQALESKWAEHVREVTRQAEDEQEQTHDKVFELQRLLSQNSSNFKSIESHLKKDIENLLKENDRLEMENKSLQLKWREAEDLMKNMKREQENIGMLRKHLMSVENGAKTGSNGRNPDLAKQVEELAKINKDLKDKNDELILHLKPSSDGCRTTICMDRQIGKSPLIQGNNVLSEDFISYDDKENTPLPDDNIHRISIKDAETSSGHGEAKMTSKIPITGVETKETEKNVKNNQQIVSNIFNPFLNTFNGTILPQDDLDQVKYKIVEILSQKDNYSKENQSLKSHQTAYSELLQQNEELHQKLAKLSSRVEMEGGREVPDLLCRDKKVEGVDRSSPDGQEKEEDISKSSCQVPSSKHETHLEEVETLSKKVSELKEEKNQLLEKNKQLEESLEMIQTEFESMEDYWQQKLEVERTFSEEQLRTSESQFHELEARMREYEELLMAAETNNDKREDRLGTIEEEREMEDKATAWEEEISELRAVIEDMEERHREELEVCRTALRNWLTDEKERDSIHQEVRRLQELRRYIQEECDQLMLKKQRLKEDLEQLGMVRKEPKMCPASLSSSSAPASLSNPLASMTSAYHVILADITREKGEIEHEVDAYPLQLVQQRLDQQVNRCKQLQSALALQKAQAARVMEDKREQHQVEMTQLEGLVNSSQALVTKQNRRFMEQMDKMVTADTVIEQLLTDNNLLALELRKMKNKFRRNK